MRLIESNAAWECKEAQSGFVASRLIKLPHHHLMDHGWMMDPLLSSLQAPDKSGMSTHHTWDYPPYHRTHPLNIIMFQNKIKMFRTR